MPVQGAIVSAMSALVTQLHSAAIIPNTNKGTMGWQTVALELWNITHLSL